MVLHSIRGFNFNYYISKRILLYFMISKLYKNKFTYAIVHDLPIPDAVLFPPSYSSSHQSSSPFSPVSQHFPQL